MNDRTPTKPGRVLITPESGVPYYAVLTMADEPTQEGTPPTKANLLSDATAAKLGGVATPNAAFDLLSRFHAGLGNEYVWEKYTTEFFLGAGTVSTDSSVCSVGDNRTTIQIADTAEDLYNKAGTYVSSTWYNLGVTNNTGFASTVKNKLAGKYYHYNEISHPFNFYCPTNVTVTSNGSTYILSSTTQYPFMGYQKVIHGYLNSTDSTAYPPAVSDGYTYTALGRIGDKVRIAAGSYVGAGTYGSGNPNSLTFDLMPQCVLIQEETSSRFS